MSKSGNLLRQAKALISDPKDWTQEGVYETSDGCMCALGAINKAWCKTPINENLLSETRKFMRIVVQNIGELSVPVYNDDPSTTHTDIMNLFDASAAIADAA